MSVLAFANLAEVVHHLRDVLENGIPQNNKPNKTIRQVLLFAHNGTGKTRLSMAFKDFGKLTGIQPAESGDFQAGDRAGEEVELGDTLYFNAFTEDLFSWDNDLENDSVRQLKINPDSTFFDGLQGIGLEERIEGFLERYTDFRFDIDYDNWRVCFFRERGAENNPVPIKVSRGEKNIFFWCFFLAITQLSVDAKEEGEPYFWVKYLYIDDPISSLDDNKAIAVASHLAQLLKANTGGRVKTVLSSHHTLFFNVMWNELSEKRKFQPYFFSHDKEGQEYSLRYTRDTPFFHHVSLLKDLKQAADSGELYTYHFGMLRTLLEKAAVFHGFNHFSACIKTQDNDPEGIVHARLVNVLSHGNYSLFEPREMLQENKDYFKTILTDYMDNYRFNPQLFTDQNGV